MPACILCQPCLRFPQDRNSIERGSKGLQESFGYFDVFMDEPVAQLTQTDPLLRGVDPAQLFGTQKVVELTAHTFQIGFEHSRHKFVADRVLQAPITGNESVEHFAVIVIVGQRAYPLDIGLFSPQASCSPGKIIGLPVGDMNQLIDERLRPWVRFHRGTPCSRAWWAIGLFATRSS